MFRIFSAVLISIWLFSTSIFMLIFNYDFYLMEFEKQNIYQSFNSKNLVNLKLREVLLFHQGKVALDNSFFNSNEINHLKEVRQLIQKFSRFYLIITFLTYISLSLLIYRYKLNSIIKIFKTSFKLIIFVSILVLMSTLFLFNNLFLWFHQISFENQYFFDPKSDRLINIFPPELFADFGLQAILQALAFAVIGYVFLIFLKINLKNLDD